MPEQHRGPLALAKQEGKDRHVCLGPIALLTCEHEVVAPVISTLASARRDVIEGDGGGGDAETAVGADRTVSIDEPSFGLGVGRATGRARRQLRIAPATATGTPAFSDGWFL